ncbi:hypothetical protein E4U57_007820 [Claviceps arundinis]|uniref:BTB domain-containing protein n=1 Tax=Claviceps arundinis TaxID=1623583 RepID=A0ABQ7PEF0_9HYPO|nr:hypothetical protein E4U57_007820 [Claviceps arundinis]
MEASASLSEEISKYTSKPCVLVVGEAGEQAFLHSYHVKRASGALGKLVDTSFAEGQNGYVVLRDVDAETILAFAQFIYAGNYYISFDMSTTATDSGNESNKTDNTEDDVRLWRRPNNCLWRRFVQSNEYKNQEAASNSYIPFCHYREGSNRQFNNGDMEQNYSELFISQAKIFVFAEYYGVETLMNMSMGRLHKLLCRFRLSRERIEDVLALIRYCYDRPGIEKLKEMVAAYSAAIIDAQVSDVVAECFRDVLRERGDFAADIACHLVSSL